MGDDTKSAFSIFAAYGGRQHALAEKKKRHRKQIDAFAAEAPPDDIANDERYTTRETIEWCKARAGVDAFDLDVAACEESHHASRFYTKTDDGLAQPWDAKRVWCNPPYSDIAPWVEKAHDEWFNLYEPRIPRVVIAMLIPATKTEQPWWHRFVEPERDQPGGILRTHFLPGRTAFARPGSGGVGQSGAPFGCVLLVWRRETFPAEPARKPRRLRITDVKET